MKKEYIGTEISDDFDIDYYKYVGRVSSTLRTIDKLIEKCRKDLESYEGE